MPIYRDELPVLVIITTINKRHVMVANTSPQRMLTTRVAPSGRARSPRRLCLVVPAHRKPGCQSGQRQSERAARPGNESLEARACPPPLPPGMQS